MASTGQLPFPRDGDIPKLWAKLNEPPPRVSDVATGISPAFDAVITKAMATEPGDRFGSAGEGAPRSRPPAAELARVEIGAGAAGFAIR